MSSQQRLALGAYEEALAWLSEHRAQGVMFSLAPSPQEDGPWTAYFRVGRTSIVWFSGAPLPERAIERALKKARKGVIEE